jgi:hypothetical protein
MTEKPMNKELAAILSEKPVWQKQAEEREEKLKATIETLAEHADEMEAALHTIISFANEKLSEYRHFKKEAMK